MASYARAAAEFEFVESRMIKLKEQAETETMLAAALVHTGHKDQAVQSINHAISQLSMVERNVEIQEPIRTSAGKSLGDARKALELVMKK